MNPFKEKKVILLPGSEFTIKSIDTKYIEKLGNVLVVELTFVHGCNKKYEWYKNIVKEITRISNEN